MTGSFERLRGTAVAAMVVGAVGSVGLMVYAAERVHAPRILLAGFVLWVLSPFVLMALGDALSAAGVGQSGHDRRSIA